MSWQNRVASSGDVIAFPPYLTTIFFPLKEHSDDAIVIVLPAKPSLAASDGSCRLLLTG